MRKVDAMAGWVFVHAHPDDETINNGGTIAKLVADGTPVTVVTCTRGERGEVIGSTYAHLEGDYAGLGAHRQQELADAMAALGGPRSIFLGDVAALAPLTGDVAEPDTGGVTSRIFEDSGMSWGPDGLATHAADSPVTAFARATVDDAAEYLFQVLRRCLPDVVVGYDPAGGYNHPDHVHAHRVTHRAVELLTERTGHQPTILWTVVDHAQYDAAAAELVARGLPTAELTGAVPSALVPPEVITERVAIADELPAKCAGLAAHATQVMVVDGAYALSNGIYHPLLPEEHYMLASFDT